MNCRNSPFERESRLNDVSHGVLTFAVGSVTRAAVGSTDRKSTRLNSSHPSISYAVFCLKKKTMLLREDGSFSGQEFMFVTLNWVSTLCWGISISPGS